MSDEKDLNNSVSSDLQQVDLWFDPLCPWAWMTSRWLLEVEKVRPIKTVFHIMSLAVLNENNTEHPKYAQTLQKEGPIGTRSAIGVEENYGQEGLRAFYTALGTRYHPGHETKGSLDVVKDALAECGFDTTIADRALDGQWDEQVRQSHAEALELVGQDVGTPVIRIHGKALFGPVISPAPKGEQAGQLFDGFSLVCAYEGFFELKRGRDVGPIFD